MTDTGITSIETALNLSERSLSIAAASPALAASKTQQSRESQLANLEKSLGELDSLIKNISELQKSSEVTNAILAIKNQIGENINKLNNFVESRISLSEKRQANIVRISALHDEFLNIVVPLVDDSTFNLVIAGEEVATESSSSVKKLMEQQVGALRSVLEVLAEGNLMSGLISIAAMTEEPANLTVLNERFVSSSQTLNRTIKNIVDRELAKKISGIINPIVQIGIGPENIFELRRRYFKVRETNPDLIPPINRKLKVASTAISAAHDKFLEHLTPMVDDISFELAIGSEGTTAKLKKTIEKLMNVDVSAIRNVMEIQAAGNLIVGLMNGTANTPDVATIQPSQERFTAAIKKIRKSLNELPKATEYAALKNSVGNLVNLGVSQSNVFDLRRNELNVAANSELALADNRKLAAKLRAEVDIILFNSRTDIGNLVQQVENAVQNGRMAMIVIVVAALLGAALIGWLYVGRNLVRRLNGLAECTALLAAGELSTEIPNGGSDELSQMAEAMQIFKDNAIERERLEAEAIEQRKAAEADKERHREDQEKRRLEQEELERNQREVDSEREQHKREDEEKRVAAERKAERQKVAEQEERARKEAERAELIAELTAKFDGSVTGVLKSVDGAIDNLQHTSEALKDTAESTNQQAANVSAAAEQASVNVQTVSAAAEQLSKSVAEIGEQASRSSEITREAVTEAASTNQKVRSLAESANKIGEVVELINDIASQTNLLALNATIEAARAGEAGKGFAVVASEVGNLASQTANATEEIAAQIAGIQSATNESVTAIEGISKTIGDVSEIAVSMASAVEEQSAATQEIARNVEQAASGTQEVTENIGKVSVNANETGQAADQMKVAIGSLGKEATSLQDEVVTFLRDIQAV